MKCDGGEEGMGEEQAVGTELCGMVSKDMSVRKYHRERENYGNICKEIQNEFELKFQNFVSKFGNVYTPYSAQQV